MYPNVTKMEMRNQVKWISVFNICSFNSYKIGVRVFLLILSMGASTCGRYRNLLFCKYLKGYHSEVLILKC